MKQYLFIASVLKDTNKVISNTESEWSKVVEGSYIKFPEDNFFYTVAKNEKIFIIKDFEVVDPKRVKIVGEAGISITKGDVLNISYKEYELSMLLGIKNPGVRYKIGDILYCNSGEPALDVVSNTYQKSSFRVSDVGDGGIIKTVSLHSRGKYWAAADGNQSMLGGSGENASFEVMFNECISRKLVQRNVLFVNAWENNTIITLDKALPPIKLGTISAEKWEVTLTAPYVGETRIAKPYEIVGDFTHNYKWPIPAKNSFSTEVILKETLVKIDQKLSELEKRLDELSSRDKTAGP